MTRHHQQIGLSFAAVLIISMSSFGEEQTPNEEKGQGKWVLVDELNNHHGADYGQHLIKKFSDFFELLPDGTLKATMNHVPGSTRFPGFYVRNTEWPELSDFELTLESKHNPEGLPCYENPKFHFLFRYGDGGKEYMKFYRGGECYVFYNKLKTDRAQRHVGDIGYFRELEGKPQGNDTWYKFKLIVQGKIIKIKRWPSTENEPERWVYESEIPGDLPAGKRFILGFKNRTKQDGVSMHWRNIQIKPYTGKPLKLYENDTMPVYLTGDPAGRRYVGRHRNSSWYGGRTLIRKCVWPGIKNDTNPEWSQFLDKIEIPAGCDKPTVKDGKLVFSIPTSNSANESKVFWLPNSILANNIPLNLSLSANGGNTPVLYIKAKDGGRTAYFDPKVRKDLAGVRYTGSDEVPPFAGYGTTHLLKDGSPIRFRVARKYGSVFFVYGSTEEPCEYFQFPLGRKKDGELMIGISSTGEAGTVTLSQAKTVK